VAFGKGNGYGVKHVLCELSRSSNKIAPAKAASLIYILKSLNFGLRTSATKPTLIDRL